MTKKRKAPSLNDTLARALCYYCDRDFDHQAILMDHLKAKHLKCNMCNRRLNTAGGLRVHMEQVHKEELNRIENAIPGREDPNVEIYGTEGIPEDVLQAWRERKTQEYYAQGGKDPNAQNDGNAAKKQKPTETVEEAKKRFAEFKARKAAEKAAGGSGPATPAVNSTSPQNAQIDSQSHMPSATPPSTFSSPFGQPPFGQPLAGSPPASFGNPYGPPSGPFPPHFSPPAPAYGMPVPPQGYPPYQPSHPPMPMPQYPVQPHGQPSFPGPPGPIGASGPNGYGRGFNGSAFNQPPQQGPPRPHEKRSDIPKSAPPRQNSLPSAPGLPPRPTFDAPPISRQQMNGLHQGQKVQGSKTNDNLEPSFHTTEIDSPAPEQQTAYANGNGAIQESAESPKVKQGDREAPATPDKAATPEKKAKTNDSKSSKAKKKLNLVVRDHEASPEERMARMSRYSFTPRKPETIRGPPEGSVARPARGYSDVAQAT
ncbi:Hypothetical protein D9617_9g023310 [Elsinoe fawcettii]|nr:Hypothetical protein D9617_9g023310 [Elsinoe fawcettii]